MRLQWLQQQILRWSNLVKADQSGARPCSNYWITGTRRLPVQRFPQNSARPWSNCWFSRTRLLTAPLLPRAHQNRACPWNSYWFCGTRRLTVQRSSLTPPRQQHRFPTQPALKMPQRCHRIRHEHPCGLREGGAVRTRLCIGRAIGALTVTPRMTPSASGPFHL